MEGISLQRALAPLHGRLAEANRRLKVCPTSDALGLAA